MVPSFGVFTTTRWFMVGVKSSNAVELSHGTTTRFAHEMYWRRQRFFLATPLVLMFMYMLCQAFVDIGGKFDAGCTTHGNPGDDTYAPNLWCVALYSGARSNLECLCH